MSHRLNAISRLPLPEIEGKPPLYLGFDTETFRGFVKVLALSDGTYIESQETNDLLEFLYRSAKSKEATLVGWNLGYDTASILKPYLMKNETNLRAAHFRQISRQRTLAEMKLKALTHPTAALDREIAQLETEIDGEETINRFDTGRWKVRLIGSKAMSISPTRAKHRKDETVWAFDAAAWYSGGFGGVSLESAASQYLGQHKNAEELGIDRAKIGEEEGYYEARREAILKYCIQDCVLTARLMDRTRESFHKIGFPFPDKPFSRASVSREYLRVSGVLQGTIQEYARLKLEARQSWWVKSFRGGVFLLLRCGKVERPYGLDLNSAYPAVMVRFPSLEGAYPVGWKDGEFDTAFFKFYRVRVRPSPRTPLVPRGATRKIYGWREEETVLMLTDWDLKAMRECGDSFEILDAVGIVCPSKERPLAYLGRLFQRKAEVKRQFGGDSMEYWALKILLNGTFGILAQRRPRESQYTNFIYSSYITAHCRYQLWKAVRETESMGDEIVGLATDGLLVSPKTPRGLETWRERQSSALGEWDVTPHEEAVLFESGIAVLDGREIKKRGFPKLSVPLLKKWPKIDFSEKEAADLGLIPRHTSPMKMRSALIQRRTSEINRFSEVSKTLCPIQAAADAGCTFPKELTTAPLSDYFSKSWPLRLRGATGPSLIHNLEFVPAEST